jgi:hypothetical protein
LIFAMGYRKAAMHMVSSEKKSSDENRATIQRQ